jgi:hypothetical protein
MTSVHTFFCPASNGVDGAREAAEAVADLADGGLRACDDDMMNDFF